MYSTCLTCHRGLGANEEVAAFPVGERLAFDVRRGRLWVVCVLCARWNLAPLEERWEAIEQCERLFRGTSLRVSTDNIGLARLASGLELIRIGPALRSEVAAWRYGRRFLPPRVASRRLRTALRRRPVQLAGRVLSSLARRVPGLRLGYDAQTWLRIHRQGGRIIDALPLPPGGSAILRYRHLEGARLLRPDRLEHWRLMIDHETGPLVLSAHLGLRSAGKLLAALNGLSATPDQVESAVRRLEDAGNPDSYFGRVAALALRTSWGRDPTAARTLPLLPSGASQSERLALYLTNRSFWSRGAIGSEPSALLPRLPLEDRLALEMAANEDSERAALEGELAELEAAWREAEEIAAIADSLFDDRSTTPRGSASFALLRGLATLLAPS